MKCQTAAPLHAVLSAGLLHLQSKPDAGRWSSFPESQHTDFSLHPASTCCFNTHITGRQTENKKVESQTAPQEAHGECMHAAIALMETQRTSCEE